MSKEPMHKRVRKGMKFGRWTITQNPVAYASDKYTTKIWKAAARCRCGSQREVHVLSLIRGASKSCGCLQKERGKACGFYHNPLYKMYRRAFDACYQPKNQYYANVGGKGISMCEEWAWNFLAFKAWAEQAGYKDDLHLARRDKNKNFDPENCYFIDSETHRLNYTQPKSYTAWGETKTLREWFADPRVAGRGLYRNLFISRLKAGWSVEDALTRSPRSLATTEETNHD